MEIELVNGKVLFNGVPFNELGVHERFEADGLLAEIKKGQSLQDVIEIAKARAREMGMDLRVKIDAEIV